MPTNITKIDYQTINQNIRDGQYFQTINELKALKDATKNNLKQGELKSNEFSTLIAHLNNINYLIDKLQLRNFRNVLIDQTKKIPRYKNHQILLKRFKNLLYDNLPTNNPNARINTSVKNFIENTMSDALIKDVIGYIQDFNYQFSEDKKQIMMIRQYNKNDIIKCIDDLQDMSQLMSLYPNNGNQSVKYAKIQIELFSLIYYWLSIKEHVDEQLDIAFKQLKTSQLTHVEISNKLKINTI